jgi:hypothetical protein
MPNLSDADEVNRCTDILKRMRIKHEENVKKDLEKRKQTTEKMILYAAVSVACCTIAWLLLNPYYFFRRAIVLSSFIFLVYAVVMCCVRVETSEVSPNTLKIREKTKAEEETSEASPNTLKIRENSRVKEFKKLILYHQTDEVSALQIMKDYKMLRGQAGLAGGGIYFAETKHETNAKAHKKGVILECTVAVGKVKEIGPGGDSTITYNSLLKDGYHSVKITGRTSGIEYVVYNWDQVIAIRKL